MSYFKTENPQGSFSTYVRTDPLCIVGMCLGTLSASILFPTALIALFLLRRENKTAVGLFFFTVPLYFLLVLMFFHYEACYLTGALAGYLPLAGYALARMRSTPPSTGNRGMHGRDGVSVDKPAPEGIIGALMTGWPAFQ